MDFKRSFRGYDTAEVDAYLKNINEQHAHSFAEQKERIDVLLDENKALKSKIDEYERDEKAISKSLVESLRLADELKNDATKFSDLVLSRAKIFYATWHAYAETLVATLSPEEVAEFNKLQEKIGRLISAYEGKENDVAEPRKVDVTTAVEETEDARPSDKTMGVNPIKKVSECADQVIDLRELTAETEQSLEEICADLGLI